MKILITTHPDLKKINPQRTHQLIRYLSRNHEITIISVNAWWINPVDDPFIDKCLEDTDYYYLSKNKINPLLQELNISKLMKENNFTSNSFDVHINFHALLSCNSVQKNYNIPTVIDICDDIIGWIDQSSYIPAIIKPVISHSSKYLLKKNINRAKSVVFSVKSLQCQYQSIIDKAYVIPNGVDTDIFNLISIDKRDLLNITDDSLILLFVGHLGEWVDLIPVFQAMMEIKKHYLIKLFVIGDGPKKDFFKNILPTFQLSNEVIFFGNIPQQDIPNYISCADVCLLPFNNSSVSHNALPIKVFEYLACEKPVLSTKLPNLEDLLGDRLMYYSNVKDFSDQIIQIKENIKNEFLYSQRRNYVAQNFSWNSLAQKYESILYKSIGVD